MRKDYSQTRRTGGSLARLGRDIAQHFPVIWRTASADRHHQRCYAARWSEITQQIRQTPVNRSPARRGRPRPAMPPRASTGPRVHTEKVVSRTGSTRSRPVFPVQKRRQVAQVVSAATLTSRPLRRVPNQTPRSSVTHLQDEPSETHMPLEQRRPQCGMRVAPAARHYAPCATDRPRASGVHAAINGDASAGDISGSRVEARNPTADVMSTTFEKRPSAMSSFSPSSALVPSAGFISVSVGPDEPG